jgi:dolichol-phosphate mannosyltransferase
MNECQLEIIIPVYNEGENINKVYARLAKILENKISWRAFFIYDFDADTTIPFLEKIKQQDARVIPIKQTYGKGVINALKFGFHNAHDGAIAVVMGDNSDDLETLPQMYQAFLNGASVVASSRHDKAGEYLGGHPVKKYLSRIAGWVLNTTGLGTKDPTNNFKLYSGKFIKSVTIESQAGFEIALELTVKAAVNGLKIVEIPGKWQDREAGVSNFKIIKWLPHYLRWFFYYYWKKIDAAIKR